MAIELFPGDVPPHGLLFSIFAKESNAMEEVLQQCFIRLSTSPATTEFCFWKMDGWEGSVPIRVWTRSLLRTATSSLCSLLHLNLSLRPASLPNWIYAYHLVHIRQGDEWEMAFITPNGLMEYLLIPFNWCNSPAIFQHLIKHIFWDLLSFCVFAYLDDFLIWSRLYLVCDCGA